jgi:hypothetical protein
VTGHLSKFSQSTNLPIRIRKEVIIPKLNLNAVMNPYVILEKDRIKQYNSINNPLIFSSSSSERSIYS